MHKHQRMTNCCKSGLFYVRLKGTENFVRSIFNLQMNYQKNMVFIETNKFSPPVQPIDPPTADDQFPAFH